ncbi:MAG: ATP-binding protein [Candidatus Paceibacterota bacterium]|jgi:hypothetical protein
MDTEKVNKLRNLITFWKESVLNDNLFPRDLSKEINVNGNEVIDIVGVRRSGKSSVLSILAKSLNNKDSWLYINFEDPYFTENNRATVIEDLIKTYVKYFSDTLTYLFFDEIQNIDSWEKSVRKYRDGSKYKIFITGSSSKLLSGELGSSLTGRHLSYNMFPLSFQEYLPFINIKIEKSEDILIKGEKMKEAFQNYLYYGGFPQVVLTREYNLLKSYYSDILQRDIIGRYDVRDKNTLEKIGLFLITNSSKIISPSSLKNLYSVSFEKVARYIDYFKESMICYELEAYNPSLKSRQRSFKKIYAVDTGLANLVSMSFSLDKGRLLENAVFLELKRLRKEIYYYRQQNYEVDFIVREDNKDIEAIQVAWNMSDPETRKRELRSIDKVIERLGIKKATIITIDTKETIPHDGYKIEVVPAYEWFLNGKK